jgi:hypothetical protein
MTFDEIVAQVQAQTNLTSAESTTRVGKNINARYRRITSAIGINLSRRTTVQADVTIGVSTLTFLACEKIINVVDRSATPYRVLTECTVEQLRQEQPASNATARKYAIIGVDAHAVTVLLDCVPQTAFTLYADAYGRATTLSGSLEPAFEEDFHDILYYGALAEEYRKMQQPANAREAENNYEARLSDLRMFRTKSSYLDIMQGGNTRRSVGVSGGSGGSGTTVNGATSWTQTGLITFDRVSAAPGSRYPFAVAVGSEKVANLDADLLDGLDSTAFVLASDTTVVRTNTIQTITALKTFNRGAAAPFAVDAASTKVANLDADKLDGVDGSDYARISLANAFAAACTFALTVIVTGAATFSNTVSVTGLLTAIAGLRMNASSFMADGFNLNIGVVVYPGRSLANPTNSINLYAGSVPSGTLANGVTIYAKDVAGTKKLCVMNSAGVETVLG